MRIKSRLYANELYARSGVLIRCEGLQNSVKFIVPSVTTAAMKYHNDIIKAINLTNCRRLHIRHKSRNSDL